jgi:hypothetical protein
MSQSAPVLWRREPDRWADHRAQYLSREYSLSRRVATAAAYGELGYSSSGIATKLETTEATVGGYLDDLSGKFGRAAGMTRLPEEFGVEAPIGGVAGD